MKNYEYKTIKFKSKFRYEDEVLQMDKVINNWAQDGWELVMTTPLANRLLDNGGKTSGILLTFKRERGS